MFSLSCAPLSTHICLQEKPLKATGLIFIYLFYLCLFSTKESNPTLA